MTDSIDIAVRDADIEDRDIRIAELEERIAAIKIDCEQREIYLSNVIEQTRKERYNAGMERAAEILDELYNTYATNEAKDIAELQAQAIRKEIEK